MTIERVEVPVLIVGGGPAGLTASLLLSRHGVDSLLVERHATASPLPRARGVHARAMEILRVCGVEADMRSTELPIRPGAEWRTTLNSPVLKDMSFGADETEVSPCEGIAVSQDVFESVIRDHARSYTHAQLRLGWELSALTLRDGGADAVLVDGASGRQCDVRAQYVIAADGARSGIRDRLGIEMAGAADLGGQRMIAFRADLASLTGGNPRGIYFLTETSSALFWTHRDDRWVLTIPDQGNAGDAPDPYRTVRDAIGDPDIDVDVLAARRWTAAAQTATRFGHEQVFLVGDAAHRTPPIGATGVSSAMHDAHNLVWKLAAVLSGRAGPGLLATYDQERGPEARRTTGEMHTAWVTFWEPGASPPTGRSMRAIDMGYRYRSSAVIPDGTQDDDTTADYVPSAAPGGRAPHLWVSGRTRSTIDLFDRHFVLLTTPSSGWRSAAAGVQHLQCTVVEEPEWPQLYGISDGGAVLVRPDGHVAWRAATPPDETALAASAQLANTLHSVCGAADALNWAVRA